MVVIKRLPRYYRYLGELIKQGISRISSATLSEKMGVTASQIRQDFNCFGEFGQQGYGYNIAKLHTEIGKILGLSREFSIIIVGAGNMGRALINYASLEKRGFKIVGIFDNDPQKIGTLIKNMPVLDVSTLEEFCTQNHVDIAALTLPKDRVNAMAKALVTFGIKGLWNFSYTDIEVPSDVSIENVHLIDSLMTLSYKITKTNEQI